MLKTSYKLKKNYQLHLQIHHIFNYFSELKIPLNTRKQLPIQTTTSTSNS